MRGSRSKITWDDGGAVTDDDRSRWPGAIESLEWMEEHGVVWADSNRVLWFASDVPSDDVYWADRPHGNGGWCEGDYEDDQELPRPVRGML